MKCSRQILGEFHSGPACFVSGSFHAGPSNTASPLANTSKHFQARICATICSVPVAGEREACTLGNPEKCSDGRQRLRPNGGGGRRSQMVHSCPMIDVFGGRSMIGCICRLPFSEAYCPNSRRVEVVGEMGVPVVPHQHMGSTLITSLGCVEGTFVLCLPRTKWDNMVASKRGSHPWGISLRFRRVPRRVESNCQCSCAFALRKHRHLD